MLRSLSAALFHTHISAPTFTAPVRYHYGHRVMKPRKRNPFWFVRQNRTIHEDYVTEENQKFISEVVSDRFGMPAVVKGVQTYEKPAGDAISLIETGQVEKPDKWSKVQRRCGLITRKIGVVPMWRKDGTKISTTMLQVDDNHVIKYIEPSEFNPTLPPRVKNLQKFGCLLVGAGSANPALFTKEYCGLFKDSGVMPKRHLGRFIVTPDAKLLPGTPLNVTHFRVGDFVDVRGKTMDRGFQGVMKRWGFKGMPASHGVTKTHRRPGNIGAGGGKARVWPGQKMPGHMGNRYRKIVGLEIVRINTEYNVLWVTGHNIPGELNNIIYVFDTMLSTKRPNLQPPFPTNMQDVKPTDMYADKYHDFNNSTIFYEEE